MSTLVKPISIAWTAITFGLYDIICAVVNNDIDNLYDDGVPLHPDVIELMREIRAADDTSLWQSWDAGHLNDIRVNYKDNLADGDKTWIPMHAATVNLLLLFRDTIDYTQLTSNPPKNKYGHRVTIGDLQSGDVDDSSGNFATKNGALSTLLHEMVHVKQMTELGTCEFHKNYLLEKTFNGYRGSDYEKEAYHYEEEVVPYKIRGRYCIAITGDGAGCNDPPSIRIDSPATGDTITTYGKLSLSASVFDPDSQYGPDCDQVTFSSNMQGDLCSTEACGWFPARCDGTIVIAGLHQITARVVDKYGGQDEDIITVTVSLVSPDAPDVSITSPAADTQFDNGLVDFVGEAYDFEGTKLVGNSLVWTSTDVDDPLGTGESITYQFDARCTWYVYFVRLTATDSNGLAGWDEVRVTVGTGPC